MPSPAGRLESTEVGGHWRQSTDSDGISRLLLDKADSSVNTLSQDVLEELALELTDIERHSPRGLIFASGKPSGFILGAEISEFSELEHATQGAEAASRGQALLTRIAELPFPTVAAMEGLALGGGLELALACDYRVVAHGYRRTLGLPEVQLGIHPGLGGTVRCVQLLGAPKALDLMLTGRSVSPQQALAMGLVDRSVPAERLDEAAVECITERPVRRRAPWYVRALNLPVARPWVARSIEAQVVKRARRAHYPAPYAIVDLWRRHGAHGREAYEAEAESIGELLVGATSRNLVRVFFLRERLRGLAPREDVAQQVHVIGAGVMGGDIAAWCALRGLTVTLQDRAQEFVEPALARARKLFERRLRGPGEADAAGERLIVDLEGSQVGSADVIIEAIVERLDAKQGVFRDLEPGVRRDALIATNTSSIRLEDMADALSYPERFVGLHFFNPVPRLPLVEVIRGAQSSEEYLQRAMSFVTQIGKLPLPCRSAPGFVVNRILAPYMVEALRAHEDGYELETIDVAAERFGMPVGPVELADRVGLDVALHVTGILSEMLGSAIPGALEAKVQAGELGAKTGQGFYRYEKDRPHKRSEYAQPDDDLQDRLILSMVNEAMACYEDGIVDDLDLLDAGVVFGTGFAPFTGGPVNYARGRGIDDVIARLTTLSGRFGARFTPHPGWQKLLAQA